MKHLFLVLLVAFATALTAQTDSLDAKIVRLLELSGAEQQFIGAADNMMALQRQQASYASIPDEWWEEFTRKVHEEAWNDLAPKLAGVYREVYTEAEIDHQLAYLSDPVTQEIVAKQPAVMQQSMQIGAEWGQQLAMSISERLQEYKNKN